MRTMKELMHVIMVGAMLASCGGYSATGPSYNPPGNGGTGGDMGGGGGSNGGGGTGGGASGGGPATTSVTVTLGNNFFRSDRNASANPAVDTVVAGGKVTWTWVNTGTVPHNVESVGAPSFTSGPVESAGGSTYERTFATPGSYRYNCAIHGDAMRGVIVVVAQ